LDETEPLMRRSLEILEQSLGADHTTTKIYQTNLAVLLQEIESRTKQKLPNSAPHPPEIS